MTTILLNLCLLFLCALAEKRIQGPKQYKFFDEKVTFHDGYIRCKQLGMDPVEIITAKEEEELKAVLPDIPDYYDEGYWLFATSLGTKPTFYWLNSGSPIVFSNYATGEPNNFLNREYCLAIFKLPGEGLKWNDITCDKKLKFICQSPSSGLKLANEELIQKQLQLKDEQWLNKSNQLIHEANAKTLQKFLELNATLEATKRENEELKEKVHSALKLPNEEWFQKQLQLRDEHWLNKSNQLIHEASSRNLQKINELAAITQELKEKARSQSDWNEWFQKQLQLKDEQWLNRSNQLIREENSRNLQKINELNATLEATKHENEELKEKVHRQCPTGGDIGDIQI